MKKRLVSLLLAAACVAMMCGCGKNAEGGSLNADPVLTASGNEAGAESYVTLGEYKGIEISVPAKVEYEEVDYDLEVKSYYFNYISETEGVTDRPVAFYDMTNIDYEGKKDGVAFEGGTAKGATLLIGSGQFIDGFEEGLVGVMPGETVDLNLKFPENYGSADLAGQEVVFTVTVNFIPEMKDERVSELGLTNVSTVEQLRDYVKNAMNEKAESDYWMTAGDAVIKKVVENSQFGDLPEDLLEENKQTYMNYLDQMAAMYGMDGATYVATFGGGMEYDALVTEYATTYTKESLVAQEIAKKEGLVLSEEQMDARLEEYAAKAGLTAADLLTNGTTKDDYRESFLYEDVLNFLVDNAVNTVSE